jgi:hypothetical protein
MLDWFRANQVAMGWLFAFSAILLLAGLVAMPIVLVRMRADHFLEGPPAASFRGRHPAIRIAGIVLKNLLGLLLLLAGVAMLVLPGQGIITILVGISLLDFPGRRRLELRIVGQRHVLHAINWIRARANRPPLVLPPRGGD